MARLPRVIAIDTPHHITQRGNSRRFILESETDRLVYLRLLKQQAEIHGVSLLGYCIMTNHVHLIAVPRRPDSLSQALKHAHGRFAAYFNARYECAGHVWQGRYYSCPLDRSHLWAALRYTEMNPVRAGIVAKAVDYAWSSARSHARPDNADSMLSLGDWQTNWTPETWKDYLREESEAEVLAIRRGTHTGRPLGSDAFIQELEKSLQRRLAPQKGGRPKQTGNERQASLVAPVK